MRRSFTPFPLLLLALPALVLAHGGEDHSHDEPAASATATAISSERPQRTSDGRLFVPKAVQRQWQIRTTAAVAGEFARSIQLNGRVIADPNAGGRVQTLQGGRIEAGPQGLAVLGQRVKKGDVLAWLEPASNSIERGAQQATLAELAAQEQVLARRVERLHQLEGSVPQKEIDQAGIELKAAQQRKAAVAGSLGREALRAPVSGVVAAAQVAVGQVVEAGTVLFEIVDPARLAVEARADNAAQLAGLGRASAALSTGNLSLQLIGFGRSLREQSLPVLFRVEAGSDGQVPAVAIGQLLKVLAETGQRQPGVAVPLTAITRGPANETLVWVHAQPEYFALRPVTTAPLDATRVLVTGGLKGGEQIVVQGSTSLAQVR